MDDVFPSDAPRVRRQISDLIRQETGDRGLQAEPTFRISGETAVKQNPALLDNVDAVRLTHSKVGEVPPSPPTLRARIGSWFVRMVRRALFWYTPQILEFQRSAARAIEELTGEVIALRAGLDELAAQLARETADRKRELHEEAAARKESGSWTASDLMQLRESLREQRTHLEHEDASREHMQLNLSALEQQLRTITQALTTGQDRVSVTEERLGDAERRLLSTREGLRSQEMRLSVLLECARKRLPEMSAGHLAEFASEDAHKTDEFYVTFEDLFRGSREDIKERLRVYLPLIKEHGIGRPDMPVLDVGCGRGEWLEVLREQGLECRGVDANRGMLARCLERNLPATEGDALSYLRALEPESLGAVTGFHIIEHLPFTVLMDLFDQTTRVLKPGGVAIFETPNPANVLVGSERFYFDPTHRNPLPSPLMRFVAEERGLCRVQVLELHPSPPGIRVPENGSEMAQRFNQLFYGSQDYAIIGWKV
jgi:SAM-dependent methyltransferase